MASQTDDTDTMLLSGDVIGLPSIAMARRSLAVEPCDWPSAKPVSAARASLYPEE